MKFKKIFPILICSFMVAGGSVLAIQNLSKQTFKEAKATDYGTIEFSSANSDSTVNGMYGVNLTANDLPAGWDTVAFAPVDENSGTFVDGVRKGTEIKKVTATAYYIPVADVTVGTVATVKGTWSNGSDTFVVKEFARQWNGTTWEYGLADYDIVSLADANMPNLGGGVAINTEEAAGYGYVTDPAGLPKQKGIFGLTNNTGSYAFEFTYTVDGKMTDWFDVRIGSTGSWGRGHLLKFSFNNAWHDDGCAYIYEYTDSGDIWAPTEVHKSPEFRVDVSHGNTLQFAMVRCLGYTNTYCVYMKSNGEVAYSAVWELDAAPMTTKVGLYYTGTNATVENSRSLTNRYQMVLNTIDSTATALYFNTGIDILKPVSAWAEYFIPVDENSITLNGNPITNGKWNYFKKAGATSLFFGFGDLGITPVDGDMLFIGGMFKAAANIGGGVLRAYRMYLYDYNFQFDGTAWRKVNLDYDAADFARDLLKETRTICTGVDADNGAALASAWSTLSGANYYGLLTAAQRTILASAVSDSTVVVPTSDAEIDAMSDADALAAAMFRYEYCTAKYSLNNFIVGKVLSSSNLSMSPINVANNSVLIIVLVASFITVCSIAAFAIIRKRKHAK